MSNDENIIRQLIASWSAAFEAKDIDGLLANYAPDILAFDIKLPFVIKGLAAYRTAWAVCLPYFPEKFKSEHRDLAITIHGEMAFVHALHRIVPAGENQPTHPWLRVMVCLQRTAGQWLAVHEHISLPVDPATGQAVYHTEI